MSESTAHRLFFVNRYYRPDHSATSQLLGDVAEHLAAHGAQVIVLTSRQLYEDPRAGLPRSQTISNVVVHRLWSSRFGRAGRAGRSIDYLSFLLSVLVALLLRARRGDVVVAKTDPPFLGLVASVAARIRSASVVNWLQDLFPEVAFESGVRIPTVLRSILVPLRDLSLRSAAVNVAIGRLMAERVARAAPVTEVRVIHNWAPFAEIRPVLPAENSLRRSWNLGDRFVVGYSGNLGVAHEFETLLEAANLLSADPGIVFLIVGGGTRREAMQARLSSLGLSNVILKPYQPREALAESLSAADVHIVNLRPELEGLIVPSKFYGVLAAGRPTIFIGDPRGEIALLIAAHACGTTVPQGQAAALAEAIRQLRSSPEILARMSTHALEAASGHLGRHHGLEAWKALLDAVTPSARVTHTSDRSA